ncbi:hypothetical protein NDU88_005239 [Pleurodeles waltl]|uniref:Uncharacterized protein n=1 Tax=Pleurodeles waltl TaxID=8319 RepID=A0AAV7LKS9_PLEWA|nr:hypothetical protein NDU88_005239 [Pleurodeles waltl]
MPVEERRKLREMCCVSNEWEHLVRLEKRMEKKRVPLEEERIGRKRGQVSKTHHVLLRHCQQMRLVAWCPVVGVKGFIGDPTLYLARDSEI